MKETAISDTVIKQEFYRSTEKFQIIVIWLGILLNLIWVISDYFILPEFIIPFFLFRIAVSSSTALLLVFSKRFKINLYICMFFLVLGISVQNSYMWSVMDLQHFQQHAFAYMVLFIGAGMLVLWEIKFSVFLLLGTIISNVLFYKLNSKLSVEEFLISGGFITFTVVVFSIFLIRSRYRLTYNELKIRLELENSKKLIEQKHSEVVFQKVEIQHQKDTLEVKNQEITDSINYASNIQRALIPSEEKFVSHFRDSFVMLKPKDIVSGDFYWIFDRDPFIYYVTADCTGHGVPGGFMTMLGLSFLDQIVVGENVSDPSAILDLMRTKIINALNQSERVLENKDGMDIAICRLNKFTRELSFASANSDLYIVKSGTQPEDKSLAVYKGDRQPCGQYILNRPFNTKIIQLSEGDCIYTFTDGYADQFGGPKGKKFRYKHFQQMLLENSHLSFASQKNIISNTIEKWRGTQEQVDDILVIGIKI